MLESDLIVPDFGCNSPAIILSKVDFPEPLFPIKAVFS